MLLSLRAGDAADVVKLNVICTVWRGVDLNLASGDGVVSRRAARVEYDLSSAWDVPTLSYMQSFSCIRSLVGSSPMM